MQYTHVVFDLDGTLIDTENAVLQTWQYTLKTYGLNFTLEKLSVVLGIPTTNALKLLAADVDHNFETKWIESYGKFSDTAVFFPAMGNILNLMKNSELHLGIVTSRTKSEYERYFQKFNLDQLFNIIICADDTSLHKPNPQPLHHYAKQSNTAPESCIYIGDMPTDISCASAAGFASGLVTWNNSSILTSKPDYIFSTPNELLTLCNSTP